MARKSFKPLPLFDERPARPVPRTAAQREGCLERMNAVLDYAIASRYPVTWLLLLEISGDDWRQDLNHLAARRGDLTIEATMHGVLVYVARSGHTPQSAAPLVKQVRTRLELVETY